MMIREYVRKGKNGVAGFLDRHNIPATAAAGYMVGLGLITTAYVNFPEQPETPVLDEHRAQVDEARTALERYAGQVHRQSETIIPLPHTAKAEMQDSLDALTRNLLATGTVRQEDANAMREERAARAAYEQASDKHAKYSYIGLGLMAVSALGMFAAARRKERNDYE